MSWIPREDRAEVIVILAVVLALILVALVPIILFGDEPVTVSVTPCTTMQGQ